MTKKLTLTEFGAVARELASLAPADLDVCVQDRMARVIRIYSTTDRVVWHDRWLDREEDVAEIAAEDAKLIRDGVAAAVEMRAELRRRGRHLPTDVQLIVRDDEVELSTWDRLRRRRRPLFHQDGIDAPKESRTRTFWESAAIVPAAD